MRKRWMVVTIAVLLAALCGVALVVGLLRARGPMKHWAAEIPLRAGQALKQWAKEQDPRAGHSLEQWTSEVQRTGYELLLSKATDDYYFALFDAGRDRLAFCYRPLGDSVEHSMSLGVNDGSG